mgnify:CR=1 FL=1
MRVVAEADGSISFLVDSGETTTLGNVGQVTGGAEGSKISIGNTSSGETSLNFYNHSDQDDDDMVVITDSSIDNFSFNGNNISASIKTSGEDTDDTNAILVNATNSNITSNYSDNAVRLTNTSSNNNLNLGYGHNTVIDAGDFNSTNSKGQTVFTATASSIGAMVNTGYYSDLIALYGSFATVNTYDGNDDVIIGSNSEYNDVNTGNGQDDIVNKGRYNYINTGAGADNVWSL